MLLNFITMKYNQNFTIYCKEIKNLYNLKINLFRVERGPRNKNKLVR